MRIDVLELRSIEHLDATAIDREDALVGKAGQGADGIAGGHVGEVGEVFSAKVDAQRVAVFLKSVGVFQI